MPSKPRRYTYFSLRFKHTKKNSNKSSASAAKRPFSEACARFLKVDGFVFVASNDDDNHNNNTTYDVVCHVRTDTTAPNFIRSIARWNDMTHMLQSPSGASGQHGIYPQKVKNDRWVLPITIKRVSAQLDTNPVLKRVMEAQVGKEGRVGTFLFMEDQDEPTVKARYSPVEKLLMPESRDGY